MVTEGNAGRRARSWVGLAAAFATLLLVHGSAQAAGPSAIAVDSDGTTYAGFASGAISRFSAAGAPLGQWTTPVADADGSLGAIVALDVAPSASNPNGGNVWVLDANRRVQEFTRAGSFIRGFRLEACEGSNDPAPGRKGGISLTVDSIYVAHPCHNRVYRYDRSSFALNAMATGVTAPQGVAVPIDGVDPDLQFLYVAQPNQATLRRLDLATLAPPSQSEVPVTHGGAIRDVFLGNAARIYFLEGAGSNPANSMFAAQSNGAFAWTELFNFAGGGRPTVTHPFDDPVAFDLFATTAPASTHVMVADRGNERIQRLTAQTADNNNGNILWVAAAPDPGPPAQPGTGGGTGGGEPGGGSTGSGGAEGAPSLEINYGDVYTTTPNVTLTIREPAGTTAVEIANDAEFAGAQSRSLTPSLTYDWTLDTQASDRVSRRVFARFPGATGSGAAFDEITLDRRPPMLGAPTIDRKRRPDRKGRRWILRVPADDEVSGLDRLEYGSERDGEFESRAFKSPLHLDSRDEARFVRVSDVAGNLTSAVRVKRDGH